MAIAPQYCRLLTIAGKAGVKIECIAGWPNFAWSISCGGNRETKNSRKVYAQESKTKATVSIRWMRIAVSGLRRLQKAFHLQCGLNIGPRRDAVLEGHQTFQA